MEYMDIERRPIRETILILTPNSRTEDKTETDEIIFNKLNLVKAL